MTPAGVQEAAGRSVGRTLADMADVDGLERAYLDALARATAAQDIWERVRGRIEPLVPGDPIPVLTAEQLGAELEVAESWTAYTAARDAYYAAR